jgi:hypothetical protein
MGVLRWPQTTVLLIVASQVARIIGIIFAFLMKTIILVYFSLGKFPLVRKKLIKFHINTEYFFLKTSVIRGLHPKKLLIPTVERVL